MSTSTSIEAARVRRPDSGWVLTLAALVVTFSLSACGITAPRSNEGFADLDSLGVSDTDHVLSLSVGPALLRFAARHVDNDSETQALLRSLEGVRVKVYEIDGDAGRVAERMSRMNGRLQDDGWETVMTVRSGTERVYMLLRVVDEEIRGMTVLVSDGESEAVIVNLMGTIRPEQFSDVMVALDVDAAGIERVEMVEGQES
jgi:hypothetical protein